MSGPSLTVDRYGGIYSIRKEPRRPGWWRPRARRRHDREAARTLAADFGRILDWTFLNGEIAVWACREERRLRREMYRRHVMEGRA